MAASAVDVWHQPVVGLQGAALAAVHFAARHQVGRQQLDARNVLDADQEPASRRRTSIRPCYFKMPTSFKPKAQVAPQYQLSETEIKQVLYAGLPGSVRCFQPRRNDGLQEGSAGAGKRKEQDLRLGHAARSALRVAAAVELHEAPGDHRALCPAAGPGFARVAVAVFLQGPEVAGHSVAPGQHVHGRRLPGSGHLPARSQRDLPAHRVGGDRRCHAGTRLPAVCPRHARPDSHDQVRRRRRLLQGGLHVRLR